LSRAPEDAAISIDEGSNSKTSFSGPFNVGDLAPENQYRRHETLVKEHGAWRLAYLEALVRIADQTVSMQGG
jgi:hypothetical protein